MSKFWIGPVQIKITCIWRQGVRLDSNDQIVFDRVRVNYCGKEKKYRHFLFPTIFKVFFN